MEPEGSLPCSQEPSTGPYSEPDQSNPSHPIFLRSILILSTHLRLGLPGPQLYKVYKISLSRKTPRVKFCMLSAS
jgi:hypothetical protein